MSIVPSFNTVSTEKSGVIRIGKGFKSSIRNIVDGAICSTTRGQYCSYDRAYSAASMATTNVLRYISQNQVNESQIEFIIYVEKDSLVNCLRERNEQFVVIKVNVGADSLFSLADIVFLNDSQEFQNSLQSHQLDIDNLKQTGCTSKDLVCTLSIVDSENSTIAFNSEVLKSFEGIINNALCSTIRGAYCSYNSASSGAEFAAKLLMKLIKENQIKEDTIDHVTFVISKQAIEATLNSSQQKYIEMHISSIDKMIQSNQVRTFINNEAIKAVDEVMEQNKSLLQQKQIKEKLDDKDNEEANKKNEQLEKENQQLKEEKTKLQDDFDKMKEELTKMKRENELLKIEIKALKEPTTDYKVNDEVISMTQTYDVERDKLKEWLKSKGVNDSDIDFIIN